MTSHALKNVNKHRYIRQNTDSSGTQVRRAYRFVGIRFKYKEAIKFINLYLQTKILREHVKSRHVLFYSLKSLRMLPPEMTICIAAAHTDRK